ncbi:MAG: prepilin-type N-terminal cleavage/methylation domain-containing protein [Hydrococcus sp. C42_A2020_068]|uniref:pilus assembly FimT family protein n=1 Tax=Pleurocapsa sp. PCC 7327 TaxID=118163 RepID=UPI00029FC60A|nr:prepilin-type N-terminal cleavage/methylation domain-containing protein [Pleurocapsa sp. PCC 7327]AFY78495.1 prepilin-type N-terminal cleavage/methylation domain-containing protein [Pleurocapsa sp. PCC 7327]MBF2022307.1 prepilin-type N-terminal cleavage/methylation domain-containing protein [Hydrococcus sp. C42_A2020_068]
MKKNLYVYQSKAGYTLIEILVVIIIAGVLAAIAAPSWVAFIERQRLNEANNQVYQAIRQAQSQAQKEKETWQVSLKEESGVAKLAVHSAKVTSPSWKEFPQSIRIDTTKTNLLETSTSSGIYRIRFNYKGCPVNATTDTCINTTLTVPQRITLLNQNGGNPRRCIIISTQLGAIRSSQDTNCN